MPTDLRVVVARKQMLTSRTAMFELADTSGADLPCFSPGSHIDVHTPRGLVRQYSLCSSPTDRRLYRIAVLREDDGFGGSIEMVDHVRCGDVIGISLPRNNFALAMDASESILLAAGIGITPLLSMASALHEAQRSFQLYLFCRSEADAAFVDELRQSEYCTRVRVCIDGGKPNSEHFQDAIVRKPIKGTHFYICGPGAFIDFARHALRVGGRPEEEIHIERFKRPLQEIPPGREFRVVLRNSRREFVIPSDRSVAEVLLANGIEIAVSCQEGLCGTCVTNVLEGVPDHRDFVLSEEDRQSGTVFTPCCSRALTDTLVLEI